MIVVFRINVKGIARNIARLQNVKNILQTPAAEANSAAIAQAGKDFWSSNIYTYFNARMQMGRSPTGQLGSSLYSSVGPTRTYISFMMGDIFSVGRGGSPTEYGRFLREGTNPSPGVYIPRLDVRSHVHGWHPGYDPSTRWSPWLAMFRERMREIAVTRIEGMIRDSVRKS